MEEWDGKSMIMNLFFNVSKSKRKEESISRIYEQFHQETKKN